MKVDCTYCGEPAVLKRGKEVYDRLPHLAQKKFWVCEPCDARVGCHMDTTIPLGTLATAELRQLRAQAHRALDPSWSSGRLTRTQVYQNLANWLDIPKEHCHIGQFGEEQCRAIIEAASRR